MPNFLKHSLPNECVDTWTRAGGVFGREAYPLCAVAPRVALVTEEVPYLVKLVQHYIQPTYLALCKATW